MATKAAAATSPTSRQSLWAIGSTSIAPAAAPGRSGSAKALIWAELKPLGADRVAARSGFDYRKPRGLDDAKQQAFIDNESLLNRVGVDEAVVFVDAVHPTHPVRPAGCWVRTDVALAAEQTTGRDRLNIIAVEKVNALSFIKLLGEIEGTHTSRIPSF